MTDLEIEDAIWEAWTILYAEPAASPLARRFAAALLAVTGGTQAQPHWVFPDDLWRDRLAVLAEQSVWLAAWGPRPGEPDCRGCPLPCCRKAGRGARTPISCGVQPCGSAAMSALRVRPRPNRGPGAGMIPKHPPLPARGRGGANHRHLGSGPVAARTECSNMPDVTLPL
jgi:hypothetical protein